MNEEQNKTMNPIVEEESSIDFGKIYKDLLRHKRLYFIVLPIAFVLAAIYALSLPNFYNCTVKLSPEMSGSKASAGSLASLASSFGVNLGSSGVGTEALFPTLYPDLMNSVDFKTSLFPVKVKREEDNKVFTYYDYLMNEQKVPWWSSAMKGLFSLFGSKKKTGDAKVDPFRLTKDQYDIAHSIGRSINCSVDKKTSVISIEVTAQDPLVAAMMADSVRNRLQAFITSYRTKKARNDLAYMEQLFGEAREQYVKARQQYAAFVDANQDVILQSYKSKEEDLENDMQLKYNAYTQIYEQLQLARAKVQERTPAFTVVQSASVPIKHSNRSKLSVLFTFLFLGGALRVAILTWKKRRQVFKIVEAKE